VAGRPRRKPLSDAEIDKIGNFNPYLTLPWLLVLYSPLHAVMSGQYPRPLYAYVGLGLFALLYVGTILTSFMPRIQDGRIPVALALVMVPVTGALAGSLPSALLLYSLLAVACAVVVPDRGAPLVLLGVPALGAFTAYMRGQSSDALSTALSGMLAGAVVFVMIKLFSVVDQLKETRQALAKGAVADERLRFSRDLHDLLGHTMSVVALKAEAVRSTRRSPRPRPSRRSAGRRWRRSGRPSAATARRASARSWTARAHCSAPRRSSPPSMSRGPRCRRRRRTCWRGSSARASPMWCGTAAPRTARSRWTAEPTQCC
jgi:hypothetical protein